MVKKRKQIDSYSLIIVAMVSIVAIVILVSNSGGNIVGVSGFRLVAQMEVPEKDKVFAPSLPFTLWDKFIKILGSPVLTSSSQEGVDLVLRSGGGSSKPWPPAATGTCGSGAGGIGDSWEAGLGICLLDCSTKRRSL